MHQLHQLPHMRSASLVAEWLVRQCGQQLCVHGRLGNDHTSDRRTPQHGLTRCGAAIHATLNPRFGLKPELDRATSQAAAAGAPGGPRGPEAAVQPGRRPRRRFCAAGLPRGGGAAAAASCCRQRRAARLHRAPRLRPRARRAGSAPGCRHCSLLQRRDCCMLMTQLLQFNSDTVPHKSRT
jgi:hypothetical protein